MRWIVPLLSCLVCCSALTALRAENIVPQIEIVLKVGKEGAGQQAAVEALAILSRETTEALLPLLEGIDRANPLAANWLTGAFESVADRALRSGSEIPRAELESFVLDIRHTPQSRRLAYDWLTTIDSTISERLIPGMLDDPASEFRREAVQRLLDSASQSSGSGGGLTETKELYLRAFQSARDPDQLDLAFDKLTELGEKVDLKRQLGLISDWWLIGPFDHRKGIGFEAVYPPEREIRLESKYPGMSGEVEWVRKTSDDRHAVFDLAKLIAPHKGAVEYAFHEFRVDRDQEAELRIGTPNGWKLWVNGELIFSHEEYHQSMRMDQYRTSVRLKAGANQILLKVCQNEQSEDWAQRWQFQVRICDASGTAVQPVRVDTSE